MNVATAWCLINCQAMGITRCFPVYQNTRFICVTEVTESPLKEIFDIANILGAVENYQMAGFVLIKQALQLSLCFCKILIPLCWKELEHGILNASWVLLFKLPDARNALMIILITDYSRDCDMITSCELHFFLNLI